MKGIYQCKRFARFVCVCMNEVKKNNNLVIPQKVEGTLAEAQTDTGKGQKGNRAVNPKEITQI